MHEFILQNYLWFKALHVIAFVSWMAGLLYLPRLFVYHATAAAGSDLSETFKLMEYRLYSFIMRPAMIATWLFGGLMLWVNWEGIMQSEWMHAKLALVIGLTGIHHVFGAWRKKFAADANMRGAKFYKIWNEVPTLILIAVAVLAVVKPF